VIIDAVCPMAVVFAVSSGLLCPSGLKATKIGGDGLSALEG
jgi:hypothetical protein